MSEHVPRRFDDASREALYRVMELRRDVRHFRPGDIDDDVLRRILGAAQLAPSVGFSQPWGFVVIRDRATRAQVRASFLRCREAEAARFPAERREKYLAYKLEGIEEATLNVCVVADLRPRDEAILGTTVQPESVRASVCCAVQNLWLAARAEGVGVGWVSIVEPAVLRTVLALPPGVEPIAYLCLGHAEEFRARPLLEETSWRARRATHDVVHTERWRDQAAPSSAPRFEPTEDRRVPPYDEASARAALEHQRLLTKPIGSLGRLEEIAAWYAGARGRFPSPAPRRPLVAVFAADHGVVVEGISAYPSSVTAAMVANVMAGGAAIACMARNHGVELVLVDVGVAGDLSAIPIRPLVPLVCAKVRSGTANIRYGPAMTRDEASRAIAIGEAVASKAIAEGSDLLAVGEIGIGNTTSAAALVCALAPAMPADVVGSGTGISHAVRERKVRVVEDALRRSDERSDALALLASLGGLELAAMCGFMLAAARLRTPVVLDGFLATAAALVAQALDRGVSPYLLASHASAERGASIALAALGKRPLLQLDLRLGEGTGAVLALDLVRTAVETQLSMASFATAGVVRDDAASRQHLHVAPSRARGAIVTKSCKRVGILFSGGPAPAANAVIGAAASVLRRSGCEVIGIRHGYGALQSYDAASRPLVAGDDYHVIVDSDLWGLRNTRGVFVGTGRANPGKGIRSPKDLDDPTKTERLRRVYDGLLSLDLDALVSIGGDDTLKTANFLYEFQNRLPQGARRVRVVHVPKTIDNDYRGIDFTFGFFTAVDVMASELLNLRADALATSGYFIVETMGRKAGWLAYGVAIAGEAHLVISVEDVVGELAVEEQITDPDTGATRREQRLSIEGLVDRIVELIVAREKRGKPYGVVVLAEGLAEMLPHAYLEGIARDDHGHVSLGRIDIGKLVARLVGERYEKRTGKAKKLTGVQLGYESRCSPPHAFDVVLGSQLGVGACKALLEKGLDGHMVSVAGQLVLRYVPFADLVDPKTLTTEVRFVERGSDFHQLAASLGTQLPTSD